jgi:hypothetical protein
MEPPSTRWMNHLFQDHLPDGLTASSGPLSPRSEVDESAALAPGSARSRRFKGATLSKVDESVFVTLRILVGVLASTGPPSPRWMNYHRASQNRSVRASEPYIREPPWEYLSIRGSRRPTPMAEKSPIRNET